MNSDHFTILALGFAKWWGCDPRALGQALRGMGHTLIEVDAEDYVPWHWNGFVTRGFRRLFLKALAGDYNRAILDVAEASQFDFILVFKGMYLQAETVRLLRSYGKPIYNFYPDVSFVDHGSYIPNALRYYDCVFTTKSFHGENEVRRFALKDMVHVRHGFDCEVHRPMELSNAQIERYGCDVSFVGCWAPEKERLLYRIISRRSDLKVVVYGLGWKYASAEFKRALGANLRRGVFGDELAIVYNASKVNLGLLSNAASDSSVSDQTTVRTFQIPASRSFLLHEDNAEVRSLFQDGKEIMLFSDADDLLTKLEEVLGDEALRVSIKNRGYERCIGAPYDYSAAGLAILSYFRERRPRQRV